MTKFISPNLQLLQQQADTRMPYGEDTGSLSIKLPKVRLVGLPSLETYKSKANSLKALLILFKTKQ